MNQVRKLQNQYLHSNTGDGTLLQAIPGGTRPKVGGAHDNFCRRSIHLFLLQLVSFTVDGDPLKPTGGIYMNTSHVIFLLYIKRVSKCVSHHMAQERVCAHHTISMVIHDVRLIYRLFSLCSSPCSFPCVSPTPCSSLPNSTCTLS